MKKSVAIVLCVALMISLCGCVGRLLLLSKEIAEEEKAFSDAVTALTTALDKGDEEAIYNLFSPAVRDDNDNLRGKVKELVEAYEGPIEKIGDIEHLNSHYSAEDDYLEESAETVFPVYANGKYYWIFLNIMYENSYKRMEGVTQLDFYSAADYYEAYYGDEEYDYNKGINIYNTAEDINVVSVNNYPKKILENREINLDEVRRFIKSSHNIKEFKERFGQPPIIEEASEDACYYLLPDENGEKRFVEIVYSGKDIDYVNVLDRFKCLEEVWTSNTCKCNRS